MWKKTIFAITGLMIMISTVTALTVNNDAAGSAIVPGQDAPATNISVSLTNETVHLDDVTSTMQAGVPFTFTHSNSVLGAHTASCPPNTTTCNTSTFYVSVNASVPQGFRPGTFTGETTLHFANRSDVTVTYPLAVAKHREYAPVVGESEGNVSVGSATRRFASVRVNNTGNVALPLGITVTGNLSQFLDYPDSITAYPGLDNTFNIGVNVPADTMFGAYRSTVRFTGSGVNASNLSLGTTVEDNIKPDITTTTIPSFMATKTQNFTIEATDNVEVANVTADITYIGEVTQGNTTIEKRLTLDTLHFTETSDGIYTAALPQEKTGRQDTYTATVTVADTAGNTANVTTSFDIQVLDAFHLVDDYMQLQAFRTGTEHTTVIGNFSQETTVTATLESFSHGLDSNTWKVALQDVNGRSFFDGVNDSVTVREGEVELYVYGEANVPRDGQEVFNGEINFTGVPQHRSLPVFEFDGTLKNYTIPENQSFNVFGSTYRFDAVVGSTPEETGYRWSAGGFIPITEVNPNQNLSEQIQVGIIEQEKQDTLQPIKRERDEAVSRAATRTNMLYGSLFITLVMSFWGYWKGYVEPSMYRNPLPLTVRDVRGGD